MKWTNLFDEVLIEAAAVDTPLARRVCAIFPAHRVKVLDGPASATGGAGSLTVAVEKGAFLRRCPGTPGMICCNLFVLNLGVGCPYGCSFCFLHNYQNQPGIRVYANFLDAMAEVEEAAEDFEGDELRVTTGEFADSLALEELTGMASELIPPFGRQKKALLELKTKSDQVDSLLGLEHGGQVVVSWSLSPAVVAQREECGAPPLEARLAAAQKAAAAGYLLAFHFDPVFLIADWQQHYVNLVDKIFDRLPGARVRWFSLGGFRYTQSLKNVMEQRDSETPVFLHEFVPCDDGKFRYFAPLRAEMYRILREAIERRAPRTPVYACMESAQIWKKAFGSLPAGIEKLGPIFGPFRAGCPSLGSCGQRS